MQIKEEDYVDNIDIQNTYNKLWNQGAAAVQKNSLKADPYLLNKASDNRRGLSVVCRPSQEVCRSVQNFLSGIKEREPNQYFYTPAQLHTTILSIITCSTEVNMAEIEVNPYFKILSEAIESIPAFPIKYRGVTATPDSVLIQGFPEDAHLEKIRHRIRSHIKRSSVLHTLDQRYRTHTAHMTCLRYQTTSLNNSEAFLKYLQDYKEYDFGTNKFTNLEFVLHDWYMSEGKTKLLREYPLESF